VDDQVVNSPDGRFEVPLPVENGRVYAVVEAQGYQPEMFDAPADNPELGDIRLKPEPKVQGRVVDSGGGPIGGASVSCDMCTAPVTSDANGSFDLAVPPRVGAVTVTGKKGDLTGTVVWNTKAGGPLEVTLHASVHVTGHVFDSTGAPAAGVEVEAVHMERSDPFSFVTMQDGSYSADLPEGNYRVVLSSQHPLGVDPITFVRVSGSGMTLDFGPAPGTVSVAVNLLPGPGQALWLVRGELTSVGSPPFELFKSAWAQMVYQPRQPRVVMQGLAPGRYSLVWSGFHAEPGSTPAIRVVDVPGTPEVSLVP
jgi:hypothetical protein